MGFTNFSLKFCQLFLYTVWNYIVMCVCVYIYMLIKLYLPAFFPLPVYNLPFYHLKYFFFQLLRLLPKIFLVHIYLKYSFPNLHFQPFCLYIFSVSLAENILQNLKRKKANSLSFNWWSWTLYIKKNLKTYFCHIFHIVFTVVHFFSSFSLLFIGSIKVFLVYELYIKLCFYCSYLQNKPYTYVYSPMLIL